MGNRTKEARSRNISHIHSKATKPEKIVRNYLFSRGLRYRKNVSSFPEKPDIILSKYKMEVLLTGVFRMLTRDANGLYRLKLIRNSGIRDLRITSGVMKKSIKNYIDRV